MILFWVTAAILFLLASGFYSGSEMGLYCMNPLRARLRAERGGSRSDRLVLQLHRRQEETVLAILLGTNLANYLLTVAADAVLVDGLHVPTERIEFITAAILSPLIFVIGDVVPKNWYQSDANRLMRRSALVLRATMWMFEWTGLLWLLRGMTRLSATLAGHRDEDPLAGPRGEVVGLLREGAAVGAMTQDQTLFVEGVMNLSTVRVGELMIPRRHVTTVPLDATRRQFEEIIRHHHYSRLPVIGRDRRTVVGIVNVLDVLGDEGGGNVADHLRGLVTIEASETAARALIHMQKTHAPMAVVIDPRRGFVGIFTLKDLVEEIFGELHAW